MRVYTIALTSFAIGAPPKWTDNLLSHHDVAHVLSARRGVARRILHAGLLELALTRELHVQCGMSVREALALARQLLSVEAGGVVTRGHVRIAYDRSALERTLDRRLREALESAPSPRRGRPPRHGRLVR